MRLPGSEFERLSEDTITISPEDVWLKGKTAAQMLVALRPGKVSAIEGWETVMAHPKVVSGFARCLVGDEIHPTHNVNQRFCVIDIVCDSNPELKQITDWVYDTLIIRDENGENMVTSKIDTEKILQRDAAMG